jgi:hypothetical protein
MSPVSDKKHGKIFAGGAFIDVNHFFSDFFKMVNLFGENNVVFY